MTQEFNAELLGSLTAELTTILKYETQLLTKMDIEGIKPLLARKQEIAYAMEKQRQILLQNPEVIKSVTMEEKVYLRGISAEFDEAMQGYQLQLFKAQRVNSEIINKIAEFMRDHVQQNRAYNRKGTQNLSGTELARNTPGH